MITKEEALSDKYNPQSSAIDTSDVHLMDAVLYGMDLFAESFSVEFDEWKLNEGYRPINWLGSKYWTKDMSIKNYLTSLDLYKLFLQSINQNEK